MTTPLCWQDQAHQAAKGIRQRVLEYTIVNKGGYLSQACSAAEMLATLYTKIMRLGPPCAPMIPLPFGGVPGPGNPHSFTGYGYNGPKGTEYDRFILSPSQYALVLYAALIEVGRMAPEGLQQFNRDGSTVEMIGAEHSPGHEVMSGSLGQGLSQAAGIAMARKLRGEKGRVWVFMSDGEFQSGMTWEALSAMAFHGIGNLGIYVDVNGQQCDGVSSSVMNNEPLHERAAAFGARVFRVDGHDIEALAGPAELEPDSRPLAVFADTDPCRGVELLRANAPKLHYLRFRNEEEREKYRDALKGMA